MRFVHVAIVNRFVAGQLLRGCKAVESRFYRRKRPPLGRIQVGDTVYFKLSGGQVIGQATVARVRQFWNLTPAGVLDLRRRYNAAVGAPPRYWRVRRRCRYGLLVWITPLSPPPAGLNVPRQYGNGWLVLDPS
jgi:hypothetical protein